MLDKNGSIMQALVKVAEVYGIDYIEKHKNAPCCYSEHEDGTINISFLFESDEDRPELSADYLGWTVYATVKVDPTTAEAHLIDGIMPNGKRVYP